MDARALIDAEEEAALAHLEAEYAQKRLALRRSFANRRSTVDLSDSPPSPPPPLSPKELLPVSAPTPAPMPESATPPIIPMPDTRSSMSAAPPATSPPSGPPPVAPPPAPPPAAPPPAVPQCATHEPKPSSPPPKPASVTPAKERMTLWEREQYEKSEAFIEEQRQNRIQHLDQQRDAELDAARKREEAWRQQDEERYAAELQQRKAVQAQRDAEANELVVKGKAEQAQIDAAMSDEQRRLEEEMERQRQLKLVKDAPAPKRQVSEDFAYAFEPGMEAKVKAFRQRGQGGDCIIMRIDHGQDMVLIDEQCKALPSLEALADKLEETDPRYVLYIHKVAHRDGRVQYPIAFFLFMPDHVPVHLKVLYTRPVVELADTFKVARHFTLDDPENLTEEWLEEMLDIVRK